MFNSLEALHQFYRSKIAPGFAISRDALVLDVGSGDKPFWRADVLVDDISLGDAQRSSGGAVQRPYGVLFDGRADALPFEDESFDFVYCSHLLEHVEDPARVIAELLRVTKPTGGGYIEVPSMLHEMLSPFGTHLWMVFEHGGGLTFYRKSPSLHAVMNEGKHHFYGKVRGLEQNGERAVIRFWWRKATGIDCRVVNEVEAYVPEASLSADYSERGTLASKLNRMLSQLTRKVFYGHADKASQVRRSARRPAVETY